MSLNVVGLSEGAVRHQLPSIKHRLIILFTSRAQEHLASTAGGETLRREAPEEVRRVMASLARDGGDQIEDLYFTSFVLQ